MGHRAILHILRRKIPNQNEQGQYTYMETTPIQHKKFGQVHYVLLAQYDDLFVAYDASYKQFLTAVAEEPAYLVVDKFLPWARPNRASNYDESISG